MLFLFVILLMTISLPEGGCVVSICYIVGDHWFARGWLCCFYLLYCWWPLVCQRVVVLFLFVILLMTIGLAEGGCVVSICYIVDDHWFARGWLCCFYLLYFWWPLVCQREVVLFLFVILLMTIGLPEGGCVVSICYIVDDHWFARGWLCCFYLLYCWWPLVCQRVVVLFLFVILLVTIGLPEGGCVVFTLEIKVCQRVVVLFLLWR